MRLNWPAALFVAALGVFGALDAIFLSPLWISADPPHLDFVGIWSWARMAIERPPAEIYDHARQQAFLLSLDPGFPVPMPFPYPPPYLLLIAPLGWLSYPAARAIWSAATLLAYMAAVGAPDWRPRTMTLALLAPASAVNLLYGQNGFLTAALLIGGVRLAPTWPVCGGVLLGLLAYKPQFGLVVVAALAAAKMWRAGVAAAAAVAAATAASLIAFGVAPWIAWVGAMPDFVAIVDAQRARLLHLMPTGLSNVLALGASDRVAWAAQGAAIGLAVAAVWFFFRRANGRIAAAALAVAAVLASPYAFVYDLTLVGAAIALLAGEPDLAYPAATAALAIVAAIWPAAMLLDLAPPLASVVHGALLGAICVAEWRSGRRVATANIDGSGIRLDRAGKNNNQPI